MRNFECLLFVLKGVNICYYLIYVTVPLIQKNIKKKKQIFLNLRQLQFSHMPITFSNIT